MDDEVESPTNEYEFNDFVIGDSEVSDDSDHGADIDETNIIEGRRKRRKPQRYVDSDFEELLLADVPDDERSTLYEDDDDDIIEEDEMEEDADYDEVDDDSSDDEEVEVDDEVD